MKSKAASSPPPPKVPSGTNSELAETPKHSNLSIISGPGQGTSGRRISLLSTLFKVSVKLPDEVFYQYNVSLLSEDDKPVEGKGVGRKLIDKLYQTYSSELGGKKFAYDGGKTLYTVGSLPQNKSAFKIVLQESFSKRDNGSHAGGGVSPNVSGKRSKQRLRSGTFKIAISYAARIPLKSLTLALKGTDIDNGTREFLRVLDIALRQQAANRGGLLVGFRGFYTTQAGLSYNMDVSTTTLENPRPVIYFLLANQDANNPRNIHWLEANQILKNLRIKTIHHNMEYEFIGPSETPCNQLYFSLKERSRENIVEITVYEYFAKHWGIQLTQCIQSLDIGKPTLPNYVPCELYTNALSSIQRASLVERSRTSPNQWMQTSTDLKLSNSEDWIPQNGLWNFNNKDLFLNKDVSHGSPAQSEVSLIAMLLGSRSWPLRSRYIVRTQLSDVLRKPTAKENGDYRIISELLPTPLIPSPQENYCYLLALRNGVDFLYDLSKISIAPILRAQLVFQCQDELINSGRLLSGYSNSIECLSSLLKNEGVRSLWRGSGVNIVHKLADKAIKSLISEAFKGSNEIKPNLKSIEDILSSVVSLSLLYPLEYGYIKLASGNSKGNFIGLIETTIKTRGIQGLYCGYSLTLGKATLSLLVSKTIMKIGENNFGLQASGFWNSALVQVTTTSLLYPMETLRNRLIVNQGERVEYKSYRAAVYRILKKEGATSFIKGLRPLLFVKTVLYSSGDWIVRYAKNTVDDTMKFEQKPERLRFDDYEPDELPW